MPRPEAERLPAVRRSRAPAMTQAAPDGRRRAALTVMEGLREPQEGGELTACSSGPGPLAHKSDLTPIVVL